MTSSCCLSHMCMRLCLCSCVRILAAAQVSGPPDFQCWFYKPSCDSLKAYQELGTVQICQECDSCTQCVLCLFSRKDNGAKSETFSHAWSICFPCPVHCEIYSIYIYTYICIYIYMYIYFFLVAFIAGVQISSSLFEFVADTRSLNCMLELRS